jgi:hypothetical protein
MKTRKCLVLLLAAISLVVSEAAPQGCGCSAELGCKGGGEVFCSVSGGGECSAFCSAVSDNCSVNCIYSGYGNYVSDTVTCSDCPPLIE